MNRNVLKIVALVSMIFDHIGLFFFPNIVLFRVVGRIAFPIFAFFVAEGLKYTKNRKKYILMLLGCGLLTQIPYSFLFEWYNLNIIFTFLIAILVVYLIETTNKQHLFNIFYLVVLGVLLILVEPFKVVDYGICGVLLILVFYFAKQKVLKFVLAGIVLSLLSIKMAYLNNFVLTSFKQFASLITIVALAFYNNQKGKLNLKYLFYIFYPAHFFVFWLILLLI